MVKKDKKKNNSYLYDPGRGQDDDVRKTSSDSGLVPRMLGLARMTLLRIKASAVAQKLWRTRRKGLAVGRFRIQSGMTDNAKRVLSWVVTAVLIIQVVLPGGLFKFVVEQAHASITITVDPPNAATDWDIGDPNTISWTTVVVIPDVNPSYFKLYYSENSGGSWTSIDSYEAWSGTPQNYNWTIPVVNGAGESDFEFKVEAYNASNVLLASDASDDFRIDYGPPATLVVDAQEETATNTAYWIDAWAKDQYGNYIVNLEGSRSTNTNDGDGQQWEAVLNWDDGTIHWTTPLMYIAPGEYTITVTDTLTGAHGHDVITVPGAGFVYTTAPTASGDFDIGNSTNITFKFGGTAVNHFDLYYSQNNGTNWTSIESGVSAGSSPQTYSWTIPVMTQNLGTQNFKVKVESYDVTDTFIDSGISPAFIIDFGSVASFTVVAPATATPNKFFSLTVTAKDTYGNTITTFNNTVALGATPTDISPVTIGNGSTTGTWASGVVTYDSYLLTAPGLHTITATYSGATGQTTISMSGGGPPPPNCDGVDITAPASNVVGFLDANNNIIPVPISIYKGPITVVVEAQDPYMDLYDGVCPLGTGVDYAELKLRKGTGDWESKGNGIYFMPKGGKRVGYDYYKWTLDVPANTFVTWYFYSIATDYVPNVEAPPGPPGYDKSVLVDSRLPYVTSTNPVSGQTNVANNANILISFSMSMNPASVWSAFSVTKQGSPTPPNLRWAAVWTSNNQVVTFTHATVYDYSGVYTVKIDPAIATNANGAPLDITNPKGAPMPFSFTVVAAPQPNKPNLSTSTKVVNLTIAPAGSQLTYTIVLRNTGSVTANVIFKDPIPTNTAYDNLVKNATYDAATNSIIWSGTLNRSQTRTITFRVKINAGVANGTVITNKATFSDGFGMTFDRYANTVVNTVPDSKVIGNLNASGVLVTPMQGYTYLSPLTIVAQAQPASALAVVNLYYRTSVAGDTVYKDFGPGVKYQDLTGDSAYYKWDFVFPEGQNLVYYFYSRAIDTAGNVETAPSTYDAFTRVNTIRPYITLTSPAHNAVNVPISGSSSYVRITFSAAMDRASVISAFKFSRVDNVPVPDFKWVATWNTASTQVTFTHPNVPFEYYTQYKVFIDPAIAKDANGKYLNNADSRSKPNPFNFTTAKKQVPDLTASVKLVDSPIVKPGVLLLFTIKVDNYLGGVAANVILTDPLPTNTTYANYVSGGLRYDPITKIFTWSGRIPAGLSQTFAFQVWANTPLDNNLNIVNTVTMKDQTNPAIQKSATSIISSTPDWMTSYKTVVLPSNRTDGKARPGDTLTYTVYLANTGNMNATNVTVTDNIPANTFYVDGSSTAGGFVYDPGTNTLKWQGAINVGQNKTFSYQIKLDTDGNVFAEPNNKVTSHTTVVDGVNGYNLEIVTMVEVPIDPIIDHPRPIPPYITDQIQPGMNAKSVKLYSPIVVPFSEPMNSDSLQYEMKLGNLLVDVNKWGVTWSPDCDQVTLQSPTPLDSGEIYTIHVIDAIDFQGQHLITDGPVPDNTWSFTTVRPMLTYAQPEGPISFIAGQVSPEIILKLVDWVNFNIFAAPPQYLPYAVEGPQDLVLNFETTSTTGRMGKTPTGTFYTKTWGPWFGKPADPNEYLKILVGKDAASLYYTDAEIGHNSLMAADSNTQGYVVIDPESKPVITTTTSSDIDQIYFASDPQRIPVNSFSNPIIFGIINHGRAVELEAGRSFLLHSTSPTGRFYTSDRNPITEEYVAITNLGRQVFYRHYIRTTTMTETIYYKDATPGSHNLTIADGQSQLGTAGVAIQSGIAQSAGQNIIVLPLDITDCEEGDCELEELIKVDDDSGRVLDKIVVEPKDVTLLPGARKTFTATGYDTDGKEIANLIFSWYVIAGGGTIVKTGLPDSNHTSRFTAGRVPGVYYDTVMAVAYYNGNIMADNATVRVARVISYGAPGALPSTGPNGIQLLFMILTLISAVALAAVEHYEKTSLAKQRTQTKV